MPYKDPAKRKAYTKKYRAENKEKIAAKDKKWYAENKEKVKAAANKYYAENREKVLEQAKSEESRCRQRKYYAENKEVIAAYNKNYQDANKEKLAEYNKEWSRKNPDKASIKSHTRRAKKEGNGIFVVADRFMRNLYNSPCVSCGTSEAIEADHIIPIVKGGRHSEGNLQPLCRSCNSSKGVKLQIEWVSKKKG